MKTTSIIVENTVITPSTGKSIVSMSISAEGTNLISMQVQVTAPKAMTDLVDIQDHLAKVAIEHLEVLLK